MGLDKLCSFFSPPFFTRETIFVTSCLFFCFSVHQVPSEKRFTIKGKEFAAPPVGAICSF